MLFAGCDLHKQTISVCVMDQSRSVLQRRRLFCQDEAEIRRFFESLGAFQVVVEATASYEWFVRRVEPLARRVLLAHPRKLRVIAESTRKSDQLDAAGWLGRGTRYPRKWAFMAPVRSIPASRYAECPS